MITFGSACLMRTDNSRAAKPVTTKDDRFHHRIFDKQSYVPPLPPRGQTRPFLSNVLYRQKPANGRLRVEQRPAWLQSIIVNKKIIIYNNLLRMAIT